MAKFQPVKLAYSTHEPVGGANQNLTPVIFLHGLSAFKETWEDIPQIVANATKRLCYSVDARNHGDSEWSDEFSFTLNVDDILHFMDTMGIKKASIVGQSMGGITAIRTALRKPERIDKIVVEDMVVRRLPQQVIDTILKVMAHLKKAVNEAPTDADEDEVKKFVMRYVFTKMPSEMKPTVTAGKSDEPEKNIRFVKLRRDADGRYKAKCNLDVIEKALKNWETLDSDPEGLFEGPACFIYGKISPFLVGADEAHIRQFFPNAVLEGLEEVGHDVHQAKPLEFTDALLKFIS